MEPESCDCGACEVGFECLEDEEGNYCVDPDCYGDGCPPDKCWEGLADEHGLGALCTEDDDCDTEFCVSVDDEDPFCTYHCQDCCPTGYSCGQVLTDSPDVLFACLPDCQPDCDGKECGSDGCGGSCGTCPCEGCKPDEFMCDANGQCEAQCEPCDCWSIIECMSTCDVPGTACRQACLEDVPIETQMAFNVLMDCIGEGNLCYA